MLSKKRKNSIETTKGFEPGELIKPKQTGPTIQIPPNTTFDQTMTSAFDEKSYLNLTIRGGASRTEAFQRDYTVTTELPYARFDEVRSTPDGDKSSVIFEEGKQTSFTESDSRQVNYHNGYVGFGVNFFIKPGENSFKNLNAFVAGDFKINIGGNSRNIKPQSYNANIATGVTTENTSGYVAVSMNNAYQINAGTYAGAGVRRRFSTDDGNIELGLQFMRKIEYKTGATEAAYIGENIEGIHGDLEQSVLNEFNRYRSQNNGNDPHISDAVPWVDNANQKIAEMYNNQGPSLNIEEGFGTVNNNIASVSLIYKGSNGVTAGFNVYAGFGATNTASIPSNFEGVEVRTSSIHYGEEYGNFTTTGQTVVEENYTKFDAKDNKTYGANAYIGVPLSEIGKLFKGDKGWSK